MSEPVGVAPRDLEPGDEVELNGNRFIAGEAARCAWPLMVDRATGKVVPVASDDYYLARIPGAPNPLTPLLDEVETRMTPSDLVYHYDPRPVGESPVELWWASLKEGDEIPLCAADGTRIGTATLGPRLRTEPAEGVLAFRLPKAADISDEKFMAALNPVGQWTTWGEVTARLGFPAKVVLAKARILIDRRKTLHGCPCGCSGGWHRADECRGC